MAKADTQVSAFVCINILVSLVKLKAMHNGIRRIREICLRPDGYVKFIQTIYVLFILISFIILMVYFIIKPGETSKLDIFLVIVPVFLL